MTRCRFTTGLLFVGKIYFHLSTNHKPNYSKNPCLPGSWPNTLLLKQQSTSIIFLRVFYFSLGSTYFLNSTSPFHLCKDAWRPKISSYFSTAFKHILNLSTSKFSRDVHMLKSPLGSLNSGKHHYHWTQEHYLTCPSQPRGMILSGPITSSMGQIPKHPHWGGKRLLLQQKLLQLWCYTANSRNIWLEH